MNSNFVYNLIYPYQNVQLYARYYSQYHKIKHFNHIILFILAKNFKLNLHQNFLKLINLCFLCDNNFNH